MKIPKLFKKAAALVMAAVTVLSVLPATTAFAAGDIGTISFTHTYDSNGNAMRYNSSANIGGYTAGGTGNYKYRIPTMAKPRLKHPKKVRYLKCSSNPQAAMEMQRKPSVTFSPAMRTVLPRQKICRMASIP